MSELLRPRFGLDLDPDGPLRTGGFLVLGILLSTVLIHAGDGWRVRGAGEGPNLAGPMWFLRRVSLPPPWMRRRPRSGGRLRRRPFRAPALRPLVLA